MVNSLYRLQQAVTKVRLLPPYERFSEDSNSLVFSADHFRVGHVSSSHCRCSLIVSGGTSDVTY